MELGEANVDHLLDRLTSKQIAEWVAFYSLEPFGNEWRQAAVIASTIAEANRNEKKRSKPFTPDDFMPKRDEGPKDSNQLLAMAKAIMARNKR